MPPMPLQILTNGLIVDNANHYLGNLMNLGVHGIHDATLGVVDVTPEQAERHNALLAEQTRLWMQEGRPITLYLCCEPASASASPSGRRTRGEVIDFTGNIRFPCHTRTSRHNIARWRYDCWFTGPDGYEWHGIRYGDNSTLVRCRRTKRMA